MANSAHTQKLIQGVQEQVGAMKRGETREGVPLEVSKRTQRGVRKVLGFLTRSEVFRPSPKGGFGFRLFSSKKFV